MSRQLLQESIQQVQQEMQNAENEVKAVNAAAEYFTQADLENVEKLDNKDIAEELNKNFNTDLNENDIQKIDNIIKAEQDGDIENVGWDKADNNINMQEINKIYNENEDVFKQQDNTMQTENRIQENKIEKNEAQEGFLDKAKEAIAEKFSELQQAAQDVDIHAALRNSDNVFDKAQAELFDQIDQFTQNLHNQQKDNTMQDKNEEKINEYNEKEENINKETQEKLEAKAEQAEQAQAQVAEVKEGKNEKAPEIEASH